MLYDLLLVQYCTQYSTMRMQQDCLIPPNHQLRQVTAPASPEPPAPLASKPLRVGNAPSSTRSDPQRADGYSPLTGRS